MPVAFELQVPHHLREASKAPLRPSLAFGNKVESDHRDHLRLALGPSVQTQPRAVGFHKATRSLAHRAFVHSNVELLRAPSAVAFPECHCPRLNNVQLSSANSEGFEVSRGRRKRLRQLPQKLLRVWQARSGHWKGGWKGGWNAHCKAEEV